MLLEGQLVILHEGVHDAAFGDLGPDDFKDFVVAIRRIEALTNLDFMPLWGTNDELEIKVDGRWVQRLPIPQHRSPAR